MRKRDPTPVMVIDEGKCQLIGEAKGNEFDGVQEPLPDAMRLLLCLIDGAERRHRLVRKWQSQAAHDLHVEVEGLVLPAEPDLERHARVADILLAVHRDDLVAGPESGIVGGRARAHAAHDGGPVDPRDTG